MATRTGKLFGIDEWLLLGIAGAAAWIAWKVFNAGSAVVGAVTSGTSTAIANAWLAATLPSPMNVLGNVVFSDVIGPDGKAVQVPLSSLQIRTDSAGNVQTLYGGAIYQLQQSDLNGNWPAVRVQ